MSCCHAKIVTHPVVLDIRLCFPRRILFSSTPFFYFLQGLIDCYVSSGTSLVTQHCRYKATLATLCLKVLLSPQSLSTPLLCLIQVIQSLLHMCILKRFCVVQTSRTAKPACESSSNSEVCNTCDVLLCVGSAVSRCCRFTTLHVLLQRWMRHRSCLQSPETMKMKPEAVSLGPEVQNHKLNPARKVNSLSPLSVFSSSESVSQLPRLQ